MNIKPKNLQFCLSNQAMIHYCQERLGGNRIYWLRPPSPLDINDIPDETLKTQQKSLFFEFFCQIAAYKFHKVLVKPFPRIF